MIKNINLEKEQRMNERYGPWKGPYNLRPHQWQTYEHMFTSQESPGGTNITGQVNMNCVLKIFGSEGFAALDH